jgi:NTP pyrophosphatase (non-canonical NTP hydrolase)
LQYFPSGNLMDGGAEGLSQELADIVIQVLDLAGRHNVDLGAAIVERMNYNLCLPTPKRAPGMPF